MENSGARAGTRCRQSGRERGLSIKSRRGRSALVEFRGGCGKDLFTVGFANDLRRYAVRECTSGGRDSRHQIPIGRVRIRLRLFSLQSALRVLESDIGFHSCSLTLHGTALQRHISLSLGSQLYAANALHASRTLVGRSHLHSDCHIAASGRPSGALTQNRKAALLSRSARRRH
jgi:hypothetical protein